MEHLTADGNALPGTTIYLSHDPGAKKDCGEPLLCEPLSTRFVVADGPQIAFILYRNGLVCLSITSSQFQTGYPYLLPFLPEDPPEEPAVAFF